MAWVKITYFVLLTESPELARDTLVGDTCIHNRLVTFFFVWTCVTLFLAGDDDERSENDEYPKGQHAEGT